MALHYPTIVIRGQDPQQFVPCLRMLLPVATTGMFYSAQQAHSPRTADPSRGRRVAQECGKEGPQDLNNLVNTRLNYHQGNFEVCLGYSGTMATFGIGDHSIYNSEA